MQQVINILLIDDDPAEEIILGAMLSKVVNYKIKLTFCLTLADGLKHIANGTAIDIILLDNRLHPGEDFRESVPRIRQSNFIGPIGVISSSLTDPYFQDFQEFGADFRIDKAEFDPTAIEFLIREYVAKKDAAN